MAKKRIGFFARVDDTGLGVESEEFVCHLMPDKVLKILVGDKKQYPDRFKGESCTGTPSDGMVPALLSDVDTLFCIETPYNPRTFALARKWRKKSILRVNFEYLKVYTGNLRPDLFMSRRSTGA